MAERYTGWHRKVGDVDASPALRNRAKQLLGEIAEAQSNGAPALLVRRHDDGKGNVVHAQIAHGIPSVRFETNDNTPVNILATYIQGFATAPRTFASATAFETFPDVIVETSKSDTPTRSAFFHDGPRGRPYKKNTSGQELYFFPTPGALPPPPIDPGLRINNFGYVDWRDKSEDVTINYGGPASRYFSFNGTGLDNYVYHNGEILLDITTVTPSDGGSVAGACISRGYLVWCTVSIVGGIFGSLVYRLYRAKIHRGKRPFWAREVSGTPVLLGPRYRKLVAADAELLFTATIPDAGFQFYSSNVFFNQSGTELRGLYYNTDATTLYARELTINFANWTTIVSADVAMSSYSETIVTTRSYPACRTDTLKHHYAETDSGADYVAANPGTTTGSYTISSTVNSAYWHDKANTLVPARGTQTNSFVNPWLLALQATYTRTVTPTIIGNFPVAVDYQDDRTVYAYLYPISSTETCTYSGSMNYSQTYNRYRTFDYTTGIGGGVTNDVDHYSYTRHLDASSSSTYVKTGFGLGLWVPKTRPADLAMPGNWFNAQLGYTDNGSTSSTSASNFATDHDSNVTTETASWSATAAQDSTVAADVNVWWMDLRFDSAAYSTFRNSSHISDSRVYSGSFLGTVAGSSGAGNSIIGWVGDGSNQYMMSLPGTRDATTTHSRTCTSYVMMNRLQVASCAGARPIANDIYSNSVPLTDYDQAMFGLRALGFCEKESELFDGRLGGVYDSGNVLAAWTAIYSANPAGNAYGPMPYASYVVNPETTNTTFANRVASGTAPAATPEYSASAVASTMCAANWPTEGNLHPGNNYDRVPGGAWIYMREDWAFSMAWLNGNTSTIQWHTILRGQDIAPMQTLDGIVKHTAESYAPMWPFAKAIYSFYRKLP